MANNKKVAISEKVKEMNDLLITGEEFAVIDIESTALSPEKGGMIIEIGGVKIRNGEIVDTFSELINPERKIYAKTTNITGITNEMLEGKRVYGQVLPDFYRFLGNAIVVAHNSDFDWNRFFMYYFPKVGIYPTNKVIDTLALARLYLTDMPKYSLNVVCEHFNISLENHHRALDDAQATAELLLAFKENCAKEMFNSSYRQEGEQQDLFNLAILEENENIEIVDIPLEVEKPAEVLLQAYKLKRIKYWEKELKRNTFMRRIYVTITEGTVYFDVHTKSWYNKDVKSALNFDQLTTDVLTHLQLRSLDEFCAFRN